MLQRAIKYRTFMAVPILKDGSAIGVIGCARREVRPFTAGQIGLVKTFADQAVIAIENVRLFDEVQARTGELSEALEQQTATSEVLGVISRSPGQLEPVFQTMLENAVRICEAKFGALYLSEPRPATPQISDFIEGLGATNSSRSRGSARAPAVVASRLLTSAASPPPAPG